MNKNKRSWILFSILAGIVLLVIVGFVCSDAIVTKTVNSKLQEKLQANERFTIGYRHLAVLLGSRTIELKNVVFCTANTDSLGNGEPGLQLHIERVVLRHVSLRRLIKDKHLHIGRIIIDEPDIVVNLPLDRKEKTDSAKVNAPLTGIDVEKIKIKDGSLRLRNTGNRMQLSLDDLQLTAHDIGYDITNASLAYNDSLYHIALENLDFTSADGLLRTQMKSLETKDAGAVVAEQLHCFNTVRKTSLADRKGKIPATWFDISLNRITTSPVNLIRQARAKEIAIDNITVDGKKALLYRDVRYPAKKPFPMPQDKLLAMKMPLKINTVQLTIPQFDIEMCTRDIGSGHLQLKQVRGTLANITNRTGDNLTAKIKTALSHGGEGDITLTMKMDKEAHFNVVAGFKDVQGESFNQFLHPLFGAEAFFTINSLKTDYKGDRKRADGTFCMTYDDIQVKVFKEETPYSLIAKNAETINLLAPTVLQRRNPRMQGKEPQSYEVGKERDEMKNFTVYLMGPVLDGVLKTVLPGSIVRGIGKKADKKAAQQDKKQPEKRQRIRKNN